MSSQLIILSSVIQRLWKRQRQHTSRARRGSRRTRVDVVSGDMGVFIMDLDELGDASAIGMLCHMFPLWEFSRDTSGWCYAKRTPDVLVRGEDWTDLRDEIIKYRWSCKFTA